MTKYFFIFLLAALILPIGRAETSPNDFEAELRLLEHKEMKEEEKADELVQKMSVQNNPEGENLMMEDSVTAQKSATTRITPALETTPLSQDITPVKKTRRIPSR